MSLKNVSFKHIIVTRFNLSQRWDKDKLGKKVLDEDWLNERYELFEKFCIPSLRTQTNQNFEWWVYFDETLPEEYKNINKRINKEFKNFKPKYEESYTSFENNMPDDIKKNLINTNTKYLITTRLDNDDMLAKNTIELIQGINVNDEKNKILELPVGFTLGINNQKIIKKMTSKLNPFISLLEKVNKDSPVKTVYFKQHNKWSEVECLELSSKPQWIQIIHDSNVLNSLNGDFTLALGVYRRFEIEKTNEINIYWKGLVPLFKRKVKRILKM